MIDFPSAEASRQPAEEGIGLSSGEWEVDGEPILLEDEPAAEVPTPIPTTHTAIPRAAPLVVEAANPEQIIEAMLFVGGVPLTAATAGAAIRGLTAEGFREIADAIAQRYRLQHRPYAIMPREGGYALELLPAYRGLRERVFGGPRIARLAPAALDCLAAIAYRQPAAKADIDAVRGTDSGPVLRQLIRLGLIAARQRLGAGAGEVRYGTTARFLQVFGLESIEDLPRLGETESLAI